MSPPRPSAPFVARNAFGDVFLMPAAISWRVTPSSVCLGLTRSTRRARRIMSGPSTRSRNRAVSGAKLNRRVWPYFEARSISFRRSRAGTVANSVATKIAPPRQSRARIRNIAASPSEGDDLFQDRGADAHHRKADDEHPVARVGMEQWAEVVAVEKQDPARDEERQAHEGVTRHPAHRGQRLDLSLELLALAKRVRGQVQH